MIKKLYAFDIDGTLAVDRFAVDGKATYNIHPDINNLTLDETWIRFLIQSKNPYGECIAPECMRAFVKKVQVEGNLVYFLSSDNNSPAYLAKLKFLRENYYWDVKDEQLIVSPFSKYKVIEILAEMNDIDIHDCVLIDDSEKHLIDANNHGIEVHQTTEFLINGEPWKF